MSSKCIFCDIVAKKQPALFVYENKNFIVINDINPDARVHLLLISKRHFENVFDATREDFEMMQEMMQYLVDNAKKLKVDEGFRIVVNNKAYATQTIFHYHMHLLGGQQLKHTIKN